MTMSIKSLKVDFHIHTKEDPIDQISYSAYELIDNAFSKGYDALAITNHERLTYSTKLKSYAAERGIVLIPGVEATIGGKHVLLVNMPFDNGRFNSFDQIFKQKATNNLVIAPHPYFPGSICLNGQLESNPHLFDAIEYCHFYNHKINFNKKAVRFAQKYRLPVVGNSDAHVLNQLGLAYSLVEAEKEAEAIIQAIKAGRVKPISREMPLMRLAALVVRILIAGRFTRKRSIELMQTGGAFIKLILDRQQI